MAEVQQHEAAGNVRQGPDRIEALLSRVPLGIFTSAVLVIVTAITVGAKDLDSSLAFAVECFFFAAAASGGGIFFDALVDSVFVPQADMADRIRLYNKFASGAAFLWTAVSGGCWFVGAASLADHYKVDLPTQIGMFALLAVPIVLVLLVAVGESLYVVFKRIWKWITRSRADTTKARQ